MPLLNYILLTGAYLLGSVPSSVWVGKLFYKLDIRDYGSGNAGANNTFRVLGIRAGIPVLLIDVLKGYVAVKLILFNQYFPVGTTLYDVYVLLLGFMAVVGHIFPVFARFNGGKGAATILGISLAFQLYPALAAFFVFILVVIIFKYVSLGSMIASLSFPLMVLWVFKVQSYPFIVYSIAVSVIIILTHLKNIERLIRGEETRIFVNGNSTKD